MGQLEFSTPSSCIYFANFVKNSVLLFLLPRGEKEQLLANKEQNIQEVLFN